MAERVPTEKQYGRLQVVGRPHSAVLAPTRRDWAPLLRRGWVSIAWGEDDGNGYLPPLRITSAGLRALAAAADRYGLPEFPEKEDADA